MLKNYFKIAFRNIFMHKAYAAINIVGLAIGMAACLLILQYVNHELSYDQFHVQKDRIYRVTQDRYDNGVLSTQWAAGAYAVGNSFKDAFPEIADYVKMTQAGSVVVKENNNLFKIEQTYFATPSFFTVFSYPLLHGDAATALKEPYHSVISATMAKKIFGTDQVLGKTMLVNNDKLYTISGVMADMPENTHFSTEMLFSYSSFLDLVGPNNTPETAWSWDGCLTYLLLKKGTDPVKLEKKFPALVQAKSGEELKRFNAGVTYHLQPLTDIHLYSNRMMEARANGDGKTTYLMLGIALFIVVIAWINYINLATAKAISRAKEVGIRKVIGSQRKQLIGQFLFESGLLNAMAIILAALIIAVSIPSFNRITGHHLDFSILQKPAFWGSLLLLFLAGTFLSGIYPALVLSGFKPITVLKGKLVNTTQGIILRKSLVVFQFAASLFLLIGTLTVSKQVSYMKKQELGMQVDQVLVIKPPIVARDSTFMNQMTAFKQSLVSQPGISAITASSSIPGEPVMWNAGGIRLLSQDDKAAKQYRVIAIDYDYVPLYGLKLIAGRNFSKEFGTDRKAVIFNQSGIQQLGFQKPAEAIGKQIFFWGDTLSIAGVVSNFHQQSLRDAFEPLILRSAPDVRGYFSVKVAAGNIEPAIKTIQQSWNSFFPGNTFEYFFLDEHFNEQYKADQRFGTVFGIFTWLAIFVACLGLFGLASFTTLQRTKEIGIRKVLGASVVSILNLLYKEFVVLIGIAFLLAVPIGWYANHLWLQGYAFRINLSPLLFLMPLVLILIVAFLTVSLQTIRAALANPITSLRTE
ncbi:ABC transporter permease [Flavihumibacter profundi]|jgi:putative ABC transport system permease protein|uniref:ABC transporter permease n=1 Tax=Flavihumibacter profundi TaxID=2716883 RepID=UPI001CC33975|nr:ABC transporter permease [Flavihumibacter profundi]MBZ5855826.1 ABC transporter permease [Flavihumibacter profundi]